MAEVLKGRQCVDPVKNKRVSAIEVRISLVDVVVEDVGGLTDERLSRDIADRP